MGKGRAPTALEYYLLKKKKLKVYRLSSDEERAKNRAEIRGITIAQAMEELERDPLGNYKIYGTGEK